MVGDIVTVIPNHVCVAVNMVDELVLVQNNKVVKSHGIIFLDKRESLIKTNISNKNDVINVLGQPHVKSIKDENTWFYIERTKIRGGVHKLGKDEFLNNNVLVVKFNKLGVLEENWHPHHSSLRHAQEL